MVMFSIIQLGFTRFLTDRKEWIYLPPLRYMCVWCVVGVPDIGGVLPVFGCHFGFCRAKKMQRAPSVYAHRLGITAPERLDWVHKWVQQSGLMPICSGSQAHLRREVVGYLPHASMSDVSTPSHLTVSSALVSCSILVE